MVFSPTQVKFAYAKSETLPAYCKRCEFLRDCWGECPKNRLLRTPDGEPGLNYLCPGLKRFFAHAVPTAEKLAAQLRAEPVTPQQGCKPVMRRMTAAAWLLQVMLGGLCMTAGSAHAADEEARVLILNGTDPYLPAYLEIDSAMRASLAQEPGRRVVYFSEPLDAQRFQVEAYEPELVALLAKKYAGLRFDVVVAISQRALEFFNRYGAQLWPGARLVFSGWPGEAFESASGLPPDARAVVADVDVRETIELARRLQPNARRIVVISGASDLDRRNERQVRGVLAKVRRAALRVPYRLAVAGTGLPIGRRACGYDRPLPLAISRPRRPPVHAARGIACNQRPLRGARVWHRRNLPGLRHGGRNCGIVCGTWQAGRATHP